MEAVSAQPPLTSQDSSLSGLGEEVSVTSQFGQNRGNPYGLPVCVVLGVPGVTALCCRLSETRTLKVTGIIGGGTRSHLLILARNSKVRSEKEETG